MRRIDEPGLKSGPDEAGESLTSHMTNRSSRALPVRSLVCERCGTAFSCDLGGDCWCKSETALLPLPTAGGDCLCQACLRKAAGVSDHTTARA
jgi:hypothetical protein